MKHSIAQNVPATFVPIFRSIIAEVCARYFVSDSDVLGVSRIPRVARPRMVAMAMMREFSPASLCEVGRCFGRDHGTVAHAVRSVADRCETDPSEMGRVEAVRQSLRDTAAVSGYATRTAPSDMIALLSDIEANVRHLRSLIELMVRA